MYRQWSGEWNARAALPNARTIVCMHASAQIPIILSGDEYCQPFELTRPGQVARGLSSRTIAVDVDRCNGRPWRAGYQHMS